MGRMNFPGEKAGECHPPRKSHGDVVAQIGAWVKDKGARIRAYLERASSAIRDFGGLLKLQHEGDRKNG